MGLLWSVKGVKHCGSWTSRRFCVFLLGFVEDVNSELSFLFFIEDVERGAELSFYP